MSDICLRYELPGILDYFVFEIFLFRLNEPKRIEAHYIQIIILSLENDWILT